MNMREKIARAIARAVDEEMYWDSPSFLRAADNALNALMEPTEGMLKRSFAAMNETPSGEWKRLKAAGLTERQLFDAKMRPRYTAMIRAAKEGR